MGDDDRLADTVDAPDDHVQREFDWEITSPSAAVMETIGRATGEAPNDLEPLYDWIDPDALDALFRPDADVGPLELVTISFSYDEFTVIVDGSGRVELASLQE